MRTLSADAAAAATFKPSRSRCGAWASSSASLQLSGSPPAPFPITGPVTYAILRPVGKPAPPRPVGVSPDGPPPFPGRFTQCSDVVSVHILARLRTMVCLPIGGVAYLSDVVAERSLKTPTRSLRSPRSTADQPLVAAGG